MRILGRGRDAGTQSLRTSRRIDPQVADAARHSDVPDPNTYDRPNTTRESPANLTLSIVVLVVAAIVAFLLVAWVWR